MTPSSWTSFRARTSRFSAHLLVLPAQIFERLHFERAYAQRRNLDFFALGVPRFRPEDFARHFATAQFRDQHSYGFFLPGGNEHLGFPRSCWRPPGETCAMAE